jgi:hypothetical protein
MMDVTDLALNTHSRKLSGAIEQAQGGVSLDVINALNADDNAYHIMAEAVEQLDGVVENVEKSIMNIDKVTKTS